MDTLLEDLGGKGSQLGPGAALCELILIATHGKGCYILEGGEMLQREVQTLLDNFLQFKVNPDPSIT